MRLRSIGAKLTLWYTGILCLTLLVLGILAYGLLTYSLSRDIDAALHGVAQAISDQAQQSGHTPIPPDLNELFRRFFGFSPANPYFEMLTPWGRPRSAPPPSPPLGISPQALKNALHGVPTFETLPGTGSYPVRVLVMPVLTAGQVTNVVQVGISLENMYNTRRHFVLIMAALFGWVPAACYWYARRHYREAVIRAKGWQ